MRGSSSLVSRWAKEIYLGELRAPICRPALELSDFYYRYRDMGSSCQVLSYDSHPTELLSMVEKEILYNLCCPMVICGY
jgi:hypothetical protein